MKEEPPVLGGCSLIYSCKPWCIVYGLILHIQAWVIMNIASSYIDRFGVPRCGCPDFNLSTNKKCWGHKSLTYYIANRDSDLKSEVWDSLILDAFKQASSNVVINIGAGQDHHFDGPSGTLAWAYLPPKPNYNGQLVMKFDTDEIWSDGSQAGMLLKNVAAHEIGHILGLSHSSIKGALMAPYYSAAVFEPQDKDDIPRIQELYGKPHKET